MAIRLKQSTASQEIPLGYFVDSADGNTEETALTIANTDIKLWKNGATTLANKNSGGATHISNGVYYAVLDATDTNTLGPLIVFVHVSGALPVRVECEVLAANVFDSLIGGGDVLDVSVTQFNGSAVTQSGGRPEVNMTHIAGSAVSTTTAQLGVNVVNAGGTAWGSGAITAASIAADAITAAKIADGAIDAGAFAADAITAAKLASDVGSEIASAVRTELTTELGRIDVATSTRLASASYTAPLDAAGTATAVWNAATATYGSAGSYGLLVETNLDATVSSRLATAGYTAPLDAAGVRSAVGLASANLDTQLDALPTAAENADAVWDEALSGHAGAGSAGEALAAAGTAGDPWTTALPGSYSSGQAGYIIGTNLNATVSSRLASASYTAPLDAAGTRSAVGLASANLDTQLGDIPTVAELTARTLAAADYATATNLATVDTVVDAIKAKTDSLTFTVAGQVDANIQYVNDTQIQGTGAVGTDEWRAV